MNILLMNRSKLPHQIIRKSLRSSQGFSLLDALVTLAIIAILSAVALPSYDSMTDQSRRGDGIAALQEIMQQQERFFLNNMTYTTNLTQLGYAVNPVISEDEFYSVSAGTCTGGVPIARCVILTATPRGGHTGDGTLTLDNAGTQGATGDALTDNAWGH